MKINKSKLISLLLSFTMFFSFLPVNVQALGLPPTAPSSLTASNAISVTTNGAAGTQVPTAPSNLTITSKTNTSISLSWTASADNIGVTEYEIYNGTTQVGTTTSAAITYTVTGLTESTAYSFTVTAKDADGNVSPASNAISVTTNGAAGTQVPTAPSNLTTTSKTNTSVSLSWTASADNIGVTEYEIYNGTNLVGTTTGDTSFVVTNLSQGTSYVFTVKAKDAASNLSNASNALTVSTLLAVLGVPANIIATATTNSIVVTWDSVPNATSYNIEMDGVVKSNITNTTYTYTGLSSNTSHNVRVLAKDSVGLETWSEPITVWTLIQIPTNFTVKTSKNTLQASWNTVAVAEGYDIEVDGIIIDNGTSLTYVHSSLITGSSHTYRVRAKNTNTKSDWTVLITKMIADYTLISGTISKDTTLTISNSPYLVTSNLTVEKNVTLTIMPGVVLQFNPGIGMTVDGKVNAVADAQNKIVFTTSKDPLYGGSGVASKNDYWKAINVEATGELIGRYISIKYGMCDSARNYYDYSTPWGLYTEGKLNLQDSKIINSYETGIVINGNASTYIENTQISDSGWNGIKVLGNANVDIKG